MKKDIIVGGGGWCAGERHLLSHGQLGDGDGLSLSGDRTDGGCKAFKAAAGFGFFVKSGQLRVGCKKSQCELD